ncbi:RagB/SusD family nutrient uptake outer membrane protein [Ornithobacterium rhinotracheale]|uniref:RagB/SusD family nutrient uptake outer membrane protein n=1 Tax=Ornithobacterium rhinotracheale TaxID=28251 RepID=UPI00129CC0BB|nr:RagB/SusD family nutrient uptake outer membrane protein [Ornithobacterium rhinotracheale]MRI62935.1 RagB/SusD family nutrient uptake outer membrane protein [Ornithobacterium rhinotracheale]
MKKIKIQYILGALFLSFVMLSCNDFLDESPKSDYNIEIDDVQKIGEVLTAAYPHASYYPFLEPRTDNADEREIYNRMNEAMFYWQDFDTEDLDTPLNFWNDSYRGIAQVNQALESLKKFKQKTPEITALYGEALVLRAYLHFMLVNIWAEPYNPTTAQSLLGIPYVTTPEKNAFPAYSRGTLEETYSKIQEDLELGLPLIKDNNYKQPKFHFNVKAAAAFATRFYLYHGDWQKVIEYSDYVLGIDAFNAIRNWKEYQDYNFSVNDWYTNSQENTNLLLTPTESRWNRKFKNEKYGLDYNKSKELFEQFSQSLELSFYYAQKVHGVENSTAKYINKFRDFSTFESTGLNPKGIYSDNVLFTADEVLLNRVEALAMLNKYDEAILDLRSYLKAKLSIGLSKEEILHGFKNAQDLYISSFEQMPFYKASTVAFVCELRRREFVHEGLRWFDIRRYHLTVDRNKPGDSFQLNKILKREDYRKTLQIPTMAVSSGLTPNPR